MSGLRADMSGLYRICLVWGRICPVQQDNTQQKSRSEDKTMNLGPNKLTTSKARHYRVSRIKGNN
jgi:hypothetical protein